MSAHVVIEDRLVSGSRDLLDKIRALLSKKFKILHSTIQLECERCDMSMNAECRIPASAPRKPE